MYNYRQYFKHGLVGNRRGGVRFRQVKVAVCVDQRRGRTWTNIRRRSVP